MGQVNMMRYCANVDVRPVLAVLLCSIAWTGAQALDRGDTPPGLLAHWDFDQIQEGVVPDRSGNENAGTVRGNPHVAEGIDGHALRFDGQNDHIRCEIDAGAWNGDGVTVLAWVYPEGAHQHGFGGIINHINGVSNSRLLVTNQGKLLAQVRGTGESFFGPDLIADLWNHVAYVCDGQTQRWHLNGRREAEGPFAGPLRTGTQAPTIGWGYTDPEYYHFQGRIDDVRIYDRALTEEEVRGEYARFSARVEAELERREAERQRRIEQMDFVDHGVPARLATRRGVVATCDSAGSPLVLICTMDNYQRRLRSSLLVVDVEQGTTTQTWFPDKHRPIGEVYSVLLARTGMFYTMFGRTFLEFDPDRRQWTFDHSAPGMAMSFTEAPDGTIYAATHSGSHLVSFNPETREFATLARLDPTEMYPRSLAVDDAGWVYCGIGVAKANIVAYNPVTEEVRQMVDDQDRSAGTGQVYRGTDGKAYGLLKGGASWLQLFDGVATPVDKPAARDPIKTGSQGTFIQTFPNGQRITALSLPEKWLDVTQPDSNLVRRIPLEYESEGPGILSLIQGPDDRIYGSTGLPLHFFVYDPATGSLEDWAGVRHGAHYNALAIQGHRLVGAAYAGGHLAYYDTAMPWTNERGARPNPVYLGSWSRDLTRPHALLAHNDGKHVIMGGTPAYGYTGGGLLFYDLVEEQSQLMTHEQLIAGHSTVALEVLPNGDIVGGTTVRAGTGGHSVAKQGALYILDWQKRSIVYQTPIGEASAVNELRIGPDGLVYGFADYRIFFVFDPARRTMVHQEDLSQYGRIAGGQAPRALQLGPGGKFHALFGSTIVTIEPGTFAHEKIVDLPVNAGVGIAIHNGRMYFSTGSRLCSCRIAPPEHPEQIRTPEMGWISLRSSGAQSRAVLSLRCTREPPRHGFLDQNSIVLDVAGRWLVTNPALGNEPVEHSSPALSEHAERLRATTHHSTVLVNGRGQDKAGRGHVRELFQAPGFQYVAADAAGAYPEGMLKRFSRHCLLLGSDYYVIYDRLEAPAPAKFEWLLQTGADTSLAVHEKRLGIRAAETRADAVFVEPANVELRIDSNDDGTRRVVASAPDSTSQAFLAVLHTSVMRTKPEDVIALGELGVADSSGRETRPLQNAGIEGFFYRGEQPGDFIAFDVPVPKGGEYELIGGHFQSPLYGIWQLSIDGNEQGRPYDGYARGVGFRDDVPLGRATLTAGTHRFRYELVGNNPASEGMLTGLVSLQLVPVSDAKAEPLRRLPELDFTARRIAAPDVLGVDIADATGRRIALFRQDAEGVGPAQAQDLTFAGQHCGIHISPSGQLVGYSLVGGTHIERNQRLLFSADGPASVSIRFTDSSATGMLRVETQGMVRLFLPRLEALRLRGRDMKVESGYDAATAVFAVELAPGNYPVSAELAR